jgi:hypothetical protein
MTWVQTIFHKLSAHMAELRGADFKIAFYLVSQVVSHGNAEVSLSERALSDATGISLSTIVVALKRLEQSGLFLREAGGRARPDRFLLPAFRPPEGVPVSGTGVPVSGTEGVPVSGTGVPVLGTGVPVLGTEGVPVSGTGCTDFRYTGVPVSGTALPVFGPSQYKVRARASVESISSVLEVNRSIDRVLRTRTLRPDQAEDADGLRRSLHGFISAYADPSVTFREVDEAIVAQCLAIAPLPALRNCLDDLRARHIPPFQTLAFFVTVFLKSFIGCSPAQVKARRSALRVVRKPVDTEPADGDFTRAVISEAVHSVKGIG